MKLNAALKQRIKPDECRSGNARESIEVSVPLPPPVNGLFANIPGRGRVKTRRYREWVKTAGWAVQSQQLGHIDGPVQVSIVIPNTARADTDAYFKGLLDLAVRQGLIEDDKGKIVRGLTLNFADIDCAQVTIRRAQ